MSVWQPTPNAIPDGVVVQHTLYGEPQNQYGQAHTVPVGTEQLAVQPVDFSHIAWEYAPPEPPPEPVVEPEPSERDRMCIAKDNTCRAYRMTGKVYCMYHDPDTRRRRWGHE